MWKTGKRALAGLWKRNAMKVLVAEDSGTMRRILIMCLAKLGIDDVVQVDAGNKVLPMLEAEPDVGLVLLDWNMPAMNGLDCLRLIRSTPATQNIPAVMITSEASKENMDMAAVHGANGYLIKPFQQDTFCEVIGAFVK